MPPCGSTDVPVKAGSPEWGRSGAESLDRTEASPRITVVMARFRRACGTRVCGSFRLSRGWCERDAQSSRETCEIVRPPTVAQGDRDGDRLRVASDRHVAGTADELPEEGVDMELVEQYVQERPRPAQGRGAFGEKPKETWAD